MHKFAAGLHVEERKLSLPWPGLAKYTQRKCGHCSCQNKQVHIWYVCVCVCVFKYYFWYYDECAAVAHSLACSTV